MSGEAEVTNPWTPAAMQCDSYCQERASSFFDPIAAIGDDIKVHPYLAESITPNADATEWTIKVRSGISFTDGTPVNADAVIENFQRSGLGLLLAAQLVDLAKVDDPSGAKNADGTAKKVFKIDKVDDHDPHALHRQGRRPGAAAAVAGLRLLPHRPVRPDRLADVAEGCRRRPDQGHPADRLRPVHRAELRAT